MCCKQGLWCTHVLKPWIIPLTRNRITSHCFFMWLITLPSFALNAQRTQYNFYDRLNVHIKKHDITCTWFSSSFFPCLHILVASRRPLQLFKVYTGCLELLGCRITKWTCNAHGLPNLKLSLSADAWQKLMVQRGSNIVPADVCKCCHQCMHTPHTSSLFPLMNKPIGSEISACSTQIAPRSKKICAFRNDLIRGLIWRHIACGLNWASDSKPYEAYEGGSF